MKIPRIQIIMAIASSLSKGPIISVYLMTFRKAKFIRGVIGPNTMMVRASMAIISRTIPQSAVSNFLRACCGFSFKCGRNHPKKKNWLIQADGTTEPLMTGTSPSASTGVNLAGSASRMEKMKMGSSSITTISTMTSLHLPIVSIPASTARPHSNSSDMINTSEGVFIRRTLFRNRACSFTVLEIKKNK